MSATVTQPSPATRVPLGNQLRLRKEVVHPRDNPSGPAIFVGLEHIESGTGRRIGQLEVEKSRLTGRKPVFKKGDIVYGYLRPYLNKVWVADFDGLCSVDQYVYSVDTETVDPHFIAWFLRSPVFLARAPIATSPGQLPRIRTEEVAAVEIDLAGLADQRRIVELISEQMAEVERARVAAEVRMEAAEALAAAFVRKSFEELPAGITRKPLGSVAEVVRGVTFDKSESRAAEAVGTVPILRAGNIQDELDLENDLVWVPERFVSEQQMLRVGDIAVCLSSGSPALVGKTSQLRTTWRGSVGAFCGVMRPSEKVIPGFVALWLRSPEFQSWLTSRVRGANIQNLRLSELSSVQIPLPSRNAQGEFVELLEANLTLAETIRSSAARELTDIRLLSPNLLRRAFSGEL